MRCLVLMSLLASLAAGPLRAACTPPDGAIQIPNGLYATLEEMKAAAQAVRAYNAAVTAFTACLQQEQDAKIAAGGDKKKVQDEYAKRNDVEVDKLQQVADKFNAELRTYKARTPAPG